MKSFLVEGFKLTHKFNQKNMGMLDNPQRRLEMLSKNGYEDINKHFISENLYGLTARKC